MRTRLLLAAGLAAAGTGALMGAVPAAAAGGGEVRVDGSQLRYTAAAGDRNNVTITLGETYFYVRDYVAMVPGPGCEYFTSGQGLIRCAPAGITSVAVSVKDGDDEYHGPLAFPHIRISVAMGAGADVAYGSDSPEVINGGAGDDTLYGNGNNDVVNGGAGNDDVRGNLGDDVVSGGPGDDQVHGVAGDDVLYGNRGADHLYGFAGRDHLDGGPGEDTLDGGDDADTCVRGPHEVNC